MVHYRPQRSCEGYVFTGVCLSKGGGGIPACLAGGIPACLAAGLGGGCAIPVCIAGGIPACIAAGLQGVSAPRGVPGPGGSALGGAWSGGSAPGGLLPGGAGIPACTEADPPEETVTVFLFVKMFVI